MNQANSKAGVILKSEICDAPLQHDQEWANALTHAIAAGVMMLVGSYMVWVAGTKDLGLAVACGMYVASAFGTFLFSALSHFILRQPMLNTLRAWDQAMIYAMISGTYTPIIYAFADDQVRATLLSAIWIAAAVGFLHKVAWRHRVNSSGTISYLALGWLPAMPLVGRVPSMLAWAMLAGGIVYTIGVFFLINDRKARYLHAAWHLCVMLAALLHYAGIMRYVVEAM